MVSLILGGELLNPTYPTDLCSHATEILYYCEVWTARKPEPELRRKTIRTEGKPHRPWILACPCRSHNIHIELFPGTTSSPAMITSAHGRRTWDHHIVALKPRQSIQKLTSFSPMKIFFSQRVLSTRNSRSLGKGVIWSVMDVIYVVLHSTLQRYTDCRHWHPQSVPSTVQCWTRRERVH